MNDKIFLLFYDFAHRSYFFDKLVVFIAHVFPYVVVVLALLFLFFHHEVLSFEKLAFRQASPFKKFAKKWREIVLVFFSGVFAWCLAYVLKFFIHAQRPLLELPNIVPLVSKSDYSFPSGHATFFMALATAIFFSHRKAGCIFAFFALLIGLARIISGVHFPIDILGGFILGIFVAYLVRFLYNKI
ncbi:phosphatase PAP2 family protein [Patescibacteria group bacterium]|nr:phosphatase PAP2 family protein [Patescibacteria group bacterium]MBU1727789.1 phosphatase PAP2 family protein [Patescibacteria group bacterium]